ncbi:YggT family protein [Proteiniborus ethanoligenes]|uniref:YggT family protein n=1 Tax=Proteiniborus ethanoligenes TaxID=415015 RepID=A0A1H3QUJ7_9FIRM|nr:YggT family protein [Proteiniborus ethanoligenes]SDZ16678.1 YggT family protein [Proteiniborus ethanoligenes]
MSVLRVALEKLIYIIEILIFIRAILSFIARDMSSPIVSFVFQVTEPILEPFRKLIRRLNIDTGMIDFSPLLALLFLSLLSNVVNAFIR